MNVRTLIIHAFSYLMTLLVPMIAGEYMDMLDEVACHIRGNQLPFGGIQVSNS